MTRTGQDNGGGADGPWVRWAQWVRSERLAPLGPFARDVLGSLAAHESLDRGAFPNAETIGRETGRTPRLVYRHIRRLIQAGVIERVGRSRNRAANAPGACIYRILPCPGYASPVHIRDMHERDTSEGPGYASPVQRICIPDAPGYASLVLPDMHPRCRGKDQEGIRERKKEKGEEPTGASSASPCETATLAPEPGSHSDGEPQTASEGNGDGRSNAYKAMLADVATILGTVPAAIGEIDPVRTARQKAAMFALVAQREGDNGAAR